MEKAVLSEAQQCSLGQMQPPGRLAKLGQSRNCPVPSPTHL